MNVFLLCKWMKLKDNISLFWFYLKKSSKWIQMIIIIIIFYRQMNQLMKKLIEINIIHQIGR